MSGLDITLIVIGSVVFYGICTGVAARAYCFDTPSPDEAAALAFGVFWPLWLLALIIIGPIVGVGWLISFIAIPGKFTKTFGKAARVTRKEEAQINRLQDNALRDLANQGWEIQHERE